MIHEYSYADMQSFDEFPFKMQEMLQVQSFFMTYCKYIWETTDSPIPGQVAVMIFKILEKFHVQFL